MTETPTTDVVDATFVDESIPGEPAPPAGAELAVVEEALDPRNGELVDLTALELGGLAELLEDVEHFIGLAGAFRRAVVDEGARRLDRLNARKERVGNVELETNAPTVVEYREDVLRASLEELVEAGDLEAPALARIFPTPKPPPPPKPKLDKRELNKLKANPAVAGVIAAASVRSPTTRTLKVRRKDTPA